MATNPKWNKRKPENADLHGWNNFCNWFDKNRIDEDGINPSHSWQPYWECWKAAVTYMHY